MIVSESVMPSSSSPSWQQTFLGLILVGWYVVDKNQYGSPSLKWTCFFKIKLDELDIIGLVMMRTCPQRLLKLHINMFMMDQLHIDMQSDSKKKKGSDRTTRSDRQIRPNQIGPPDRTNSVHTTKRNTHNSWFPKALKTHEYPLERLWSLLSNTTSFMSFSLPNKDLWSNHWRLVRRSRVCPRIYLARLPVQDCTNL